MHERILSIDESRSNLTPAALAAGSDIRQGRGGTRGHYFGFLPFAFFVGVRRCGPWSSGARVVVPPIPPLLCMWRLARPLSWARPSRRPWFPSLSPRCDYYYFSGSTRHLIFVVCVLGGITIGSTWNNRYSNSLIFSLSPTLPPAGTCGRESSTFPPIGCSSGPISS